MTSLGRMLRLLFRHDCPPECGQPGVEVPVEVNVDARGSYVQPDVRCADAHVALVQVGVERL